MMSPCRFSKSSRSSNRWAGITVIDSACAAEDSVAAKEKAATIIVLATIYTRLLFEISQQLPNSGGEETVEPSKALSLAVSASRHSIRHA
jgi:hypothetical protein